MNKREIWERLQEVDPEFAALLSDVSREFGPPEWWRYKNRDGEELRWPGESK